MYAKAQVALMNDSMLQMILPKCTVSARQPCDQSAISSASLWLLLECATGVLSARQLIMAGVPRLLQLPQPVLLPGHLPWHLDLGLPPPKPLLALSQQAPLLRSAARSTIRVKVVVFRAGGMHSRTRCSCEHRRSTAHIAHQGKKLSSQRQISD